MEGESPRAAVRRRESLMRICLQTYAFRPSWGGVQKFVQSHYNALRNRGHKLRLATASHMVVSEREKYTAWPWTKTGGIATRRFAFTAWSLARAYPGQRVKSRFYSLYFQLSYFRYFIFLMLFRPKILHLIYINVDAAFALRAKPKLRFKLITSCRGSDILLFDKQNPAKQKLVLETLRASDAITAVSNEIAARIQDLLTENVDSIPIHVIPNGISPQKQQSIRSHQNSLRGFVFAGHLDENKNPEFLVRAFMEFHRKRPDYQLFLIGSGPLLEPLQQLVLAQNLIGTVSLPGSLAEEQTSDFIRNAAALIVPSFREGCPNVILEALSAGTPVIASARSGNKEIIRHNENGLLFEPDNPQQLIDCMENIVQSSKLRERLVQNGFRTIADRYNFDRTLEEYLILYRQLLNQ
jgi:glycosyltransferase involved in cell wall biosynthesis